MIKSFASNCRNLMHKHDDVAVPPMCVYSYGRMVSFFAIACVADCSAIRSVCHPLVFADVAVCGYGGVSLVAVAHPTCRRDGDSCFA